jgi:hypothetical protein
MFQKINIDNLLHVDCKSDYTLLKIHQLVQADGERLILRQTDTLVLRLPLWLMEFVMESTSVFTVYLPLVCLLLTEPPLVLLELVLYGENWFPSGYSAIRKGSC